MSGDNPYSTSLDDTPGAADNDHGVAQGRSAGTELADAPLAEPMSRAQYASYMRQGQAVGDGSRGDAAGQAPGMTGAEHADYTRQGFTTGSDDPGSVETADHDDLGGDDDPSGAARPGNTGDRLLGGDPAAQAQGMTRSEYAGYMRLGSATGARDHDAAVTESDHPPAERPDIAARYPADYMPSSASAPRVEGPHERPESWADGINPDADAPGRDNNCGECSRAATSTWEGKPAAAAAMSDPDTGGEPLGRMTEWAGQAPTMASMSDVRQRLEDLGAGSYAVVGCDWKGGGGHWFNAINDGGTVKAVDGQDGDVETWPPSAHGLGFDETDMRYSDAIFFTADGKVVRE
jgi:hypothetical protein